MFRKSLFGKISKSAILNIFIGIGIIILAVYFYIKRNKTTTTSPTQPTITPVKFADFPSWFSTLPEREAYYYKQLYNTIFSDITSRYDFVLARSIADATTSVLRDPNVKKYFNSLTDLGDINIFLTQIQNTSVSATVNTNWNESELNNIALTKARELMNTGPIV